MYYWSAYDVWYLDWEVNLQKGNKIFALIIWLVGSNFSFVKKKTKLETFYSKYYYVVHPIYHALFSIDFYWRKPTYVSITYSSFICKLCIYHYTFLYLGMNLLRAQSFISLKANLWQYIENEWFLLFGWVAFLQYRIILTIKSSWKW